MLNLYPHIARSLPDIAYFLCPLRITVYCPLSSPLPALQIFTALFIKNSRNRAISFDIAALRC